MNIKKLRKEELLEIYRERLVHEFHEEEIKPYDTIKRLVEEEKYIGYGYYEGEELAVYAFLCGAKGSDYLLLDYYVVESKFRSNGYGSKFINALKENLKDYKGIIGEIEDPEFAIDENDLEYRKRRIRFYERNNLHHTNIRSSVFDVRYIIMVISNNKNIDEDIVSKELRDVYYEIFGEDTVNKDINIMKKQ